MSPIRILGRGTGASPVGLSPPASPGPTAVASTGSVRRRGSDRSRRIRTTGPCQRRPILRRWLKWCVCLQIRRSSLPCDTRQCELGSVSANLGQVRLFSKHFLHMFTSLRVVLCYWRNCEQQLFLAYHTIYTPPMKRFQNLAPTHGLVMESNVGRSFYD